MGHNIGKQDLLEYGGYIGPRKYAYPVSTAVKKYADYGLTLPDYGDTICSRCGCDYWKHHHESYKCNHHIECKGFEFNSFEKMIEDLSNG